MKISRAIVDKLGVKLYDKVSAVISELIANSYDADATEVKVTLALNETLASREKEGIYKDDEGREKTKYKVTDKGHEIIVEDNGTGMTQDEMQNFYLEVGTDRRKDSRRGSRSPTYKRKVMGRKGVGKLAPFGICKEIEVISSGGSKTSNGYLTSHIILQYEEILKETPTPYKPITGKLDGTIQKKHGTKVILRNFAFRKIPIKATFHRQLARKFGLEQTNWKVKIYDLKTSDEFVVGEFDEMNEKMKGTNINLNGRYVSLEDGTKLLVNGWVAYSKEPYKDEEMAGIRIYARGKLFATTRDFGLKAGFTGEHTIRSYLFGSIHCDWLDDDLDEDVARTDRQDILWDSSEMCMALRDFGQSVIKELGSSQIDSVRKKVWEKFLLQSNIQNIVKKKYHENTEFQKQIIETARLFASKISFDEIDNKESMNQILDLALLIGPNKVLYDHLQKIGEDTSSPFESLVKLFSISRLAELATLGEVANKRVKAIETLNDRVDSEVKETELQKLLENAPWLINPEWTPLTMNQQLNTFRSKFEKWYKKEYGTTIITTTINNEAKRPDFIMLSFHNAIQIVEIKKTDHKLEDDEFKRLFGYKDSLETFLNDNPTFNTSFPKGVFITLVCDGEKLDKINKGLFKKMKADNELKHLKWHEFLHNTENVHEDFLNTLSKR